ncbi:AAA family ATPase [Pseudodesulfovibrio sp. zrk46]|uniref:AAA family ATPase n=1 Tax=Pseudodesulfovibrio sp. zrk46 TaxID=2725288 RepID=UPI001FFC52ED|nr:AAA family ATPase [Pseudodesulfovibrio sp. zrk46]
MKFPEASFQLENLFCGGELVLLAGLRKTSKSYILADLLAAAAGGKAFCDRIHARRPMKVLLVDAELSSQDLQKRFRQLGQLYGDTKWTANFGVLAIKDHGKKINLLEEADRQWVEAYIQGEQIVAFDNYGKLIPSGKGSCPVAWRVVEGWFERLRSQGITVILVQHENKAGQLRGTLKMEDDAELFISLKRPQDWQPAMGNKVEMHFPAARHLHGKQLQPLLVEYAEDENGFYRSVLCIGGTDEEVPAVHEDVVQDAEIEEYNLSPLQVEMLTKVRLEGEARAGDFKGDSRGRKSSNISRVLGELCDARLLKPMGDSKKGRYYVPW